ncbi:hypothetical protein GCM10022280_25130 [Sphingomonas swuensis]|uniref:Uncharacterized protein n=1 Tax=Sphingomonas swuensis TaxID=977800 RepID=A0ABP7TAX5_9SPHN
MRRLIVPSQRFVSPGEFEMTGHDPRISALARSGPLGDCPLSIVVAVGLPATHDPFPRRRDSGRRPRISNYNQAIYNIDLGVARNVFPEVSARSVIASVTTMSGPAPARLRRDYRPVDPHEGAGDRVAEGSGKACRLDDDYGAAAAGTWADML